MELSETTTILIVDDRDENLLAFESLLSQPDRDVVKARSGNEALSLMLDHDFALVLLDVQMPGMDGFEVAELMRSSERTRHVPIIFVTAISKDSEYVFKGYETGAVDYLLKPIDANILESKTDVFCELHGQRRIIESQVKEIARQNSELLCQLAEIKTLRGLLPICCNCKSIRNDDGLWDRIEIYIKANSDAEFTHGICPKCVEELYPEVAEV